MYNTLLELKEKNILLDLDVLADTASNLPKVGRRRCAVSSCVVIDKKRKFHRFSANPHLSEEWVKRCHSDIPIRVKTARGCSNHFLQEDYTHSNILIENKCL